MPGPDRRRPLDTWARRVPAVAPEVISPLRREVVAYARRLGATGVTCDAIALAVSEAVTNVVQHAYVGEDAGGLTLEAQLERDDQLLVRVSDDGRGPVPRADSPGLGLGLGVMAQTAEHFSISNRRGTRGTVVTLRFSLRNGDQSAPPGSGEPAMHV